MADPDLRSRRGAGRGAGAPASKRRKSPLASLVELILTIGIAVGIAFLVEAFIVKPYRIPSGSMEPTLVIGQRILVNRLATHPSVGDIVVFHPPIGAVAASPVCANPDQGPGHGQACDRATAQRSSQVFVKRVVAGPGDRVQIINGQVFLNGKREKAPYAEPCGGGPACNLPRPIVIPPGHYFMMGDNRGDSDDSRYWGPVPQSWIIGRAFFTYWPPDRIGTL